ncbi:retrovirus-related pol polyprotein from transposon TNT 1-94 [Tanacetum coccineum]
MYIRCKTLVKETWYGPRDGLGLSLGQRDKPEFEGYGVKVDKSVCEKSSKEIKKTPGALIIEDWVSGDEEQDESKPKKKTVIPTAAMIEGNQETGNNQEVPTLGRSYNRRGAAKTKDKEKGSGFPQQDRGGLLGLTLYTSVLSHKLTTASIKPVSTARITVAVPDMTQSQINNLASTSSHPVPQDRWSRDQHIKLVNINGEPTEGMLTRSMAAKLTAVSASGCLFADFLSKIEPKKEEGIDYDEIVAPVARMETIRIFFAFSTYMNIIVYQIDVKSAFLNEKPKEKVYAKQPPGFESSEFPNYVCKLEKALYRLKQAPRTWYLKGTPTLGLWYPKCSGFDLKGYLDSDYAGFNMDRKVPQEPVNFLETSWFVRLLRNNSQWLCHQLRLKKRNERHVFEEGGMGEEYTDIVSVMIGWESIVGRCLNKVDVEEKMGFENCENTEEMSNMNKSFKDVQDKKCNGNESKVEYAKIVNNLNEMYSNKLEFVMHDLDEEGVTIVKFEDDLVKEGCRKWVNTVCGYFVGTKMAIAEVKYNVRRMWGRFGLDKIATNGHGFYFFQIQK